MAKKNSAEGGSINQPSQRGGRELASILKPVDPDCVRVNMMGYKTCHVRVKDLGVVSGSTTVFAFRAAARCYPPGATPGPSDKDTAPPLSKTDSVNQIWEKIDVATADCDANASKLNTVYVWFWYQLPGNPPPLPKIEQTSLAFHGKCCNPLTLDSSGDEAEATEQASARRSGVPEVRPRREGKWLRYRLPVDAGSGGVRLLDLRGGPLRAGEILIYAEKVAWRHDADDPGSRIERSLGNYIPAPEGWRFAGLNQHALVLWQDYGTPLMVAPMEKDFAKLVSLDGRQDILMNVNEIGFADDSDYQNNSGRIGIALRVIS